MSRQHVGTVDAVAEQAVTYDGVPEGVTFDEAGWVPTADRVIEQ